MTLIMGAETTDRVIIASDSMGSSAYRQEIYGSKLIKIKNFIVGYSHSYRTAQILEFNKDKFKPINNRRDVYNFCQKLKQVMIKEAGHKKEVDKQETDLCHTVLLVMATEFGLFEIDANYQFLKLRWGAVGCGAIYGLGYFDGHDYETDMEIRLNKSIKAASKFVPGVGGPVFVKEVMLKSVLEKKKAEVII